MKTIKFLFIISIIFSLVACNSNNNKEKTEVQTVNSTTANTTGKISEKTLKLSENQSVILIYNFHLTNRCATCRAIEGGTIKTLETYFKNEINSERIQFFVIDVDDETNAKIAEKYQASGSGLFITRLFQGKEESKDLTEEGFSYARNDEAKFIEIIKTQLSEYLK